MTDFSENHPPRPLRKKLWDYVAAFDCAPLGKEIEKSAHYREYNEQFLGRWSNILYLKELLTPLWQQRRHEESQAAGDNAFEQQQLKERWGFLTPLDEWVLKLEEISMTSQANAAKYGGSPTTRTTLAEGVQKIADLIAFCTEDRQKLQTRREEIRAMGQEGLDALAKESRRELVQGPRENFNQYRQMLDHAKREKMQRLKQDGYSAKEITAALQHYDPFLNPELSDRLGDFQGAIRTQSELIIVLEKIKEHYQHFVIEQGLGQGPQR